MATGLFAEHLSALRASELPVSVPAPVGRRDAAALVARGPSNEEVLDACRAAYDDHQNAVDQVTLGGISTAQAPQAQPDLQGLRNYNWQSKVAAPALARPVYDSATMAAARSAVTEDGRLRTFFVGIELSADVIVGGVGGVGVGVPFPWTSGSDVIWMAYGGLRIALNIDVALNLNTGIFLEPPHDVAGDYLGIELSAEPVAEGPSVGFGVHLTRDLKKVRGFSVAVGVELGLLPITAAVVFGSIATT